MAKPPIALAEVQGYIYEAKQRMAALARLRRESELADRLERDAVALQKRFHEAFWVADQHYYAMALDENKNQADALGSNAGHCLWTGIVPAERAREVAGQLLGPKRFSGWGARKFGAG